MSKFRAIIAALAIVPVATPAIAADLWQPQASFKDEPVYEPQRTRWDGFYLGLNGGYGWSGDESLDALAFDLDPEGGFGGGQIGFNVVTGRLLLGAEADIQAADISDSVSINGASLSSSIDYFGTVRGRLGFVSDRTLIYGTAGYAWADVDATASFGGTSVSLEDTLSGYVVGGGIEYALTDQWSTKLEYQYIDLEDERINTTDELDNDFHTVRVGLNYRF